MLKRSLGTTLVALAATMLACLPSFADSQARIVRLSNVEGSVMVDRNSGQGYEKAFLNMPVVQGMKVATKDAARAEIEFEDGSTIRLGPKSTVEFSALSLRDSGARVSTVIVEAGLSYFNYTNSHKGDEFTVLFQNETVTPQESAHFRVDVQALDVVLATFNGNLKVEGPSGELEVSKNKSATFDLTENNKFTLAKDIEELPPDAWDKSQSKYEQAYANRNSSNNYPYSYGVSDLNYYGNYYNVPGYGMMWQPYFTGAGWDPFMDGAWMFYPGAGYMWVSSYPWGWMPYRYGAWNFVPGYGWMWAPGGFNTWYPVTPVRTPPTRFTTPQPPVRGTATVTVGRTFVSSGVPQRNLLIKDGSAGLGIPRGGVNNLNKVSRQVQQNGTMTVRTAPPARTFGGSPAGGWGAPSSAGRMGSSGGSSHTGGSSPHMGGGSSGGHSSAPPSRSPR